MIDVCRGADRVALPVAGDALSFLVMLLPAMILWAILAYTLTEGAVLIACQWSALSCTLLALSRLLLSLAHPFWILLRVELLARNQQR